MKPFGPTAFLKMLNRTTRQAQKRTLGLATTTLQQMLRGSLLKKKQKRAPARTPPKPTVAAKAPSDLRFTRHTQPGGRHYKLFVPTGFQGKRLPLLVMLHGCTQDPDDFAAGTRMNERAQEAGLLVLYPAQPRRSNTSKCWNWFQPADQRRGSGEPALLAAMVREVAARPDVDPRRVYAAGLSAGGAMAAILGREYPDLFAAVGVHSGLAAGAAHDMQSAFAAMKGRAVATPHMSAAATSVPTIVFHGDIDRTVHPSNGKEVIAGTLAMTASGLGQAGINSGKGGGRRFTRSVYMDAQGRLQAEHWIVHGAGHAWSGGNPSGSYTDAAGPDASREMLRFFLQHEVSGTAPALSPGAS